MEALLDNPSSPPKNRRKSIEASKCFFVWAACVVVVVVVVVAVAFFLKDFELHRGDHFKVSSDPSKWAQRDGSFQGSPPTIVPSSKHTYLPGLFCGFPRLK